MHVWLYLVSFKVFALKLIYCGNGKTNVGLASKLTRYLYYESGWTGSVADLA